MFCICGVCIPVNALWPMLLFLLKPMWNYLKSWWTGNPVEKSESTPPAGVVCKDGVCCMAPKEKLLIIDGVNLIDVVESEDKTQFDDIKHAPNGALVRFTASWCKPCKKIEPEFKELSKSYKDVVFASVDVDENSVTAAEAGVIALPAFQFYRNGELLGHTKGSNLEAIQDLLDEHVIQEGENVISARPKSD
jgi:thioredoxin 1